MISPVRLMVSIWCGLLTTALFAATPPDFKERLRNAIRIPAPPLNVGLTNLGATVDGLAPLDPPTDWTAELQRLRRLADNSPNDQKLHGQIGDALRQLGRPKEADEAFANVLRLRRADFKARPDDPVAMARLGSSLGMDHPEEAEPILRRSVVAGADVWECHLRLGSYLFVRRSLDLAKTNASLSEEDFAEPFRHFERAVVLAGDRSAVPLVLTGISAMLRGAWWSRIFRDPALAEKRQLDDLRLMIKSLRAAEPIEPEDYRILSVRVFFEANLLQQSRTEKANELTAPARQAIAEAIPRLTALAARSPSPHRTAEIWNAVGLLEIIRDNQAAAGESAERALRLNPLHDQAWELRLGTLVGTDGQGVRISELQALLDRPRPHPDSGRTRVIAARGYQLAGHLDKAAAELVAGRRAEPDNLRLELAEATLRLRRAASEPEAVVAKFKLGQVMDKIQREAKAGDVSPAFFAECKSLWMHGLVTQSTRIAVEESVESARQLLARLPKSERGENADYFEAMEAILDTAHD